MTTKLLALALLAASSNPRQIGVPIGKGETLATVQLGAPSGGWTVDRMMHSVGSVASTVADYAGEAKDKVKEMAAGAGDTAKHTAEKVQQWAGDAYDATSHVAGDFGKECTALVRRFPVPALLVGFGLGMLIGRSVRS